MKTTKRRVIQLADARRERDEGRAQYVAQVFDTAAVDLENALAQVDKPAVEALLVLFEADKGDTCRCSLLRLSKKLVALAERLQN